MSTINKPAESPTPTVNNPGVKESAKLFTVGLPVKAASNDPMPVDMSGCQMPKSLKSE